MANKKTHSYDMDELRRLADEKVREKYSRMPKNMEEATGVDRLVHELHVYQIELEIQNEELRKAQLALEDTRDKYIDLYDFAPVGYFTFTSEALIKEVNLAGASLLGMDRQKLINARFRRFVSPEDFDKWDQHIMSVFKQGHKQRCELSLKREDDSAFNVLLESIRIEAGDGSYVVRTAVSDITERKKVEETLQRYSAELEKSNKELQEALAKVKTLSRMLPICSYCKKIRDDKGYWNQVEAYISEHTDTVFSHGMCPECEKKAYEELDRMLKLKKGTESSTEQIGTSVPILQNVREVPDK